MQACNPSSQGGSGNPVFKVVPGAGIKGLSPTAQLKSYSFLTPSALASHLARLYVVNIFPTFMCVLGMCVCKFCACVDVVHVEAKC